MIYGVAFLISASICSAARISTHVSDSCQEEGPNSSLVMHSIATTGLIFLATGTGAFSFFKMHPEDLSPDSIFIFV